MFKIAKWPIVLALVLLVSLGLLIQSTDILKFGHGSGGLRYSEEFWPGMLEDHTCPNTPKEVLEEVVENKQYIGFGFFSVGPMKQVDPYMDQGDSKVVHILMDNNQCTWWGKCKAHVFLERFFKDKRSKPDCQYLFSGFLPQSSVIYYDVLNSRPEIYDKSCRTYVAGICLER